MKAEKAMAPHSSTLAWEIPWAEEPGGLQSMESRRVKYDWATSLSLFPFMHWRRKWQPTPVFLPGESQGRWAAIYGVTQSWPRLKWLSSSSKKLFLKKIALIVVRCMQCKIHHLNHLKKKIPRLQLRPMEREFLGVGTGYHIFNKYTKCFDLRK